MSLLQLPPLGLYIHIPWCERKCPYCDFNSHTAPRDLPEQAYIQALLEDLDQDLQGVQGRELQSIFIGGGTPSLFSVEAYQTLMSGIRNRVALADTVEVTLEANPGSAEAEKFEGFVAAGINRISLGIQSFDDTLLEHLGRVHDREQALAAIEMASHCGATSYNIDLMHGLPQQDVASACADLETALALSPPHLSWYQLTIEPNTAFYSSPPSLPVENILGDIQDEGETMITGCGYDNYEVSAWAKPNQHCRHNLNYWLFGDYIGIGAGAHGKLTDKDNAQVHRSARKKQPGEYLTSSSESRRSSSQLSADDLRGEYMLYALRLREGFRIEDYSSRTGLLWSELEATVEKLVDNGLLEVTSERMRTSALGRRYLDSVLADFFW